MPFWSRRPPEEPPSWEELFPLEALLRSQLDDVLIVEERRLVGRSLAFGGRLLVEPERGGRAPPAPSGAPRVRAVPPGGPGHGVGARDRPGGGGRAVAPARPSRAVPRHGRHDAPGRHAPERSGRSTSCGGIRAGSSSACRSAASLLGILGVHEFGHYTLGRRHGMPVSLPYFIPVPPSAVPPRDARGGDPAPRARFAIAGRCSTWRWRGRSPVWWSRCRSTCSASGCRPWSGSPGGGRGRRIRPVRRCRCCPSSSSG